MSTLIEAYNCILSCKCLNKKERKHIRSRLNEQPGVTASNIVSAHFHPNGESPTMIQAIKPPRRPLVGTAGRSHATPISAP